MYWARRYALRMNKAVSKVRSSARKAWADRERELLAEIDKLKKSVDYYKDEWIVALDRTHAAEAAAVAANLIPEIQAQADNWRDVANALEAERDALAAKLKQRGRGRRGRRRGRGRRPTDRA